MKIKSYKILFIIILLIFGLIFDTSLVFAAKSKQKKDEIVKKKPVKRKRHEIKYTGITQKRNPFSPPKEIVKMMEMAEEDTGFAKIESVKMPKVEVQGIIWSKTMPQVIVNGAVMNTGEYIQDFQIKEITRKGIVLFYKGKDYLLRMQNNAKIKKKKRKR